MGVNDIDRAVSQLPNQPPGEPPVAPRAATKRDHRDSFLPQALTQWTNVIETDDGGVNPAAKTPDGFGHQDLGTGHLHDVEHESNADRTRFARAGLTVSLL